MQAPRKKPVSVLLEGRSRVGGVSEVRLRKFCVAGCYGSAFSTSLSARPRRAGRPGAGSSGQLGESVGCADSDGHGGRQRDRCRDVNTTKGRAEQVNRDIHHRQESRRWAGAGRKRIAACRAQANQGPGRACVGVAVPCECCQGTDMTTAEATGEQHHQGVAAEGGERLIAGAAQSNAGGRTARARIRASSSVGNGADGAAHMGQGGASEILHRILFCTRSVQQTAGATGARATLHRKTQQRRRTGRQRASTVGGPQR
ncbi:hypothetical protein M011DRAFT_526542 [Sporormia fimetaria CBS 119925]|uniref:Uncharacterized protein n=1 Tax=Sporormia fimetaria CBS 119925 TaxID=1340428 RepID=A0A6A6VDB1_9PLEO|nr:hypothetical protein M011DRAFT_526542 [Sporormia fimetaria CBS 119925]